MGYYEDLAEKVFARMRESKELLLDPSPHEDLFQIARNITDYREAHLLNVHSRKALASAMRQTEHSKRLYDIYKRSLLMDAPHFLDEYMLYIESDRPVEERFYQTRRGTLKQVTDVIQKLYDDELDEAFIAMPPRVGKALADDTPILTRFGWKNHGDLVVGDEVIGMNGEFKKVIAVHPKCMLDVLVEFTNGEKIQCHERHEWKLYDRHRQRTDTLETCVYEGTSLEDGAPSGRGHRYRYKLPRKLYVQGEEKELALDPYTMGVWLGDGSTCAPRIANADADKAIIDRIKRNGYVCRWSTRHATTGVMYYDFDIRGALKTYGLCHSRKTIEKFIPQEYLTASITQRLNLLAGLLDTDGTYIKKEKRYQFTTSSKQ